MFSFARNPEPTHVLVVSTPARPSPGPQLAEDYHISRSHSFHRRPLEVPPLLAPRPRASLSKTRFGDISIDASPPRLFLSGFLRGPQFSGICRAEGRLVYLAATKFSSRAGFFVRH